MGCSIQGNVALVTGASSEIGRAIAVMLAQEGCNVALLSRDAQQLAETARLCSEARDVRTLCLPTDITDAPALDAAITRCVTELGKLTILVNVAGIFDWASALDADPDVWDRLMDVNLRSTMRATRLALPYIAQNSWGAVIFIASMAAKIAFGHNAAYVASKHGLSGFAGSVFEDVRDHNIKVCAICPGLVNAGASLALHKEPATLIQSADVAEAVRFVVTFPDNACPTEILLQPQKNPWS